jgi:LSD1 subclass zinc finger protein
MQSIVLFFKLYLLRRHGNYVNYMRDARLLAEWFNFDRTLPLLSCIDASILCGSCFTILGYTRGGAITFSCSNCQTHSNLAYEISQLATITGLKWEICTYALIKAVQQLYESNNVAAFRGVMTDYALFQAKREYYDEQAKKH